jgi:excisionase family DNA binding protein
MTSEEEFDLEEPLFTIAEVAEKLKVSDHTVRSWIRSRFRIIRKRRGSRIPHSAIGNLTERSIRYEGFRGHFPAEPIHSMRNTHLPAAVGFDQREHRGIDAIRGAAP